MKRVLNVLFVLMLIFPLVSAGSMGISPAKQEFYFFPGIEKTYTFNVFPNSAEDTTRLYVAGDLAEYVSLSVESVVGYGSFDVMIKLPEAIEVPGKHRILIGASQVPDELESGIGSIAIVQAPIDVYVPYPGKYAEATFSIGDVNEGEDVVFELEIFNFGMDDLVVESKVKVYSDEDRTELVTTKVLNSIDLVSNDRVLLVDSIDTRDMKPGPYYVVASVDYGEVLEIEDEFRIGTLLLNIVDYDNTFEEGQINKFRIEVESLWNEKIEGVRAEVSVTDDGVIVDQFKTPTSDLDPWNKLNLTGFFDASDAVEGQYTANLKVYYEDRVVYKLVSIYIISPGISMFWITVIVSAIAVVVAAAWLIIYLMVRINKLKKNGKKSKKKK